MSRDMRWIDLTITASGLLLRVAVHEIRGKRPGPTVGITAAVHGDELAPVEAVRRLASRLDPEQMSGNVRIAPVVNPLAFETHTRHTSLDMQNLNRVFPGDRNGWLTEQMAARFVDEFLPGLDVLLDLHAGGAMATVDYAYIVNDEELSATFDTPVLYRGPGYSGTLSHVAEERGIRCVVGELGGGIIADNIYIERNLRSLENALRHAGVIPGDVCDFGPKQIVEELQVLRPHHGGVLDSDIPVERLGEVVPRGTLLGTVYNPQTFEALEDLIAPFDQTVMILTRGAPTRVETGDYAFIVARAR